MTFTLTVESVPMARALKAADDLERAVGEIASGKRKPSMIPLEEIAVLVQHARNTQALRDALEIAKSGLEWYYDTYPDVVNDSDAEAMAQIDAALAKVPE